MSVDLPPTLAGFSEDEWTRALRRTLGDGARPFVADLFAQLRHEPSNGFALTEDDFALLSLVDESCASRVRQVTATYPEEFRDRVDALVAWYRDEDRQLPSAGRESEPT